MKTILMMMIGISAFLSADFSRDGDTHIVTDSATALEWQDGSLDGALNWEDAIERCRFMTFGGYDDWRLPNINEYNSIVDYSTYNPALVDIFVNYDEDGYWTSTSVFDSSKPEGQEYDSDYAWTVNRSGVNNWKEKLWKEKNVRCVRGGK